MDLADLQARQNRVKDDIGIHCQKLFQNFLEEFKEDDEVKYLEGAKELVSPERSTLVVSFDDIEKYNQVLATTIIEEYYRVHPYLCQAVCNFVKDTGELRKEKECYVSLVDVPTRHKLRELTTSKIGTLIRISGQVVRTHPVHPELVLGTFVCVDCNAVIKNVEQQFKFTNPTICNNPVCANRRRFVLDVDNSVFVDFQKVRIQETQSELPRGCIPRSLEVILRAETVETVQAGDRYDFTGTLIVVPDVGALAMPGTKAKTTIEGTSLRGDINCCIVGDPSTAKSQLLKQVADISPRAVYTSGKASSAAGLTAAVVRDEESGDFVIEAGALMLADNGICCIDEFDKMDPKDQVAIHEAMEQQTISIAKAGVRASLNARTSILAAANPIGSRYDRSKSLQQNVALTAPIMSRFDLFFILVDECNEIIDNAIAKKIVDLHSNNAITIDTIYEQPEILRYINFAKHFKPVLNPDSADYLVESYTTLRQREGTGAGKSTWRVTVRQLESLVRLSEALAKLECADRVTLKHVKEARRLLSKSIVRVEQPDIDFEDDAQNEDAAMELDDAPPLMEALNAIDDTNGDNDHSQVSKKKLTMSFDAYKSLTNMLVLHMRNEESRMENENDNQGIRKSELVAWRLDQIQDEIDSEEELLQQKALTEKIITRLIYHDQIIIPLTTGQLDASDEDEDPLLVVHPNYVVDN